MAEKPRIAWNDALAALSRRALTLEELRRKLRRHHDERTVEETVRRLVDARYVDDREVAYNHAAARANAGRRGPLRVKAELLARGIDRTTVDEAVAAAFPDHRLSAAVDRAAALIEKRAASSRAAAAYSTAATAMRAENDRDGGRGGQESREKTARKLMTAGFPHAAVAAWLSRSRGAGYGGDDEFP